MCPWIDWAQLVALLLHVMLTEAADSGVQLGWNIQDVTLAWPAADAGGGLG